jgi:hypothetical protein
VVSLVNLGSQAMLMAWTSGSDQASKTQAAQGTSQITAVKELGLNGHQVLNGVF